MKFYFQGKWGKVFETAVLFRKIKIGCILDITLSSRLCQASSVGNLTRAIFIITHCILHIAYLITLELRGYSEMMSSILRVFWTPSPPRSSYASVHTHWFLWSMWRFCFQRASLMLGRGKKENFDKSEGLIQLLFVADCRAERRGTLSWSHSWQGWWWWWGIRRSSPCCVAE